MKDVILTVIQCAVKMTYYLKSKNYQCKAFILKQYYKILCLEYPLIFLELLISTWL